jgi:hypothetical protein
MAVCRIRATGHDDLGPAFVEARHGAPLRRGHPQQPRQQLVEPLAAHPVALQPQRRAGILGGRHGRNRHGGAAGGHQHRPLAGLEPLPHLEHRRLQRPLNEGPQKLHPLGGQRVVVHEFPLQAHRPHAGAGEGAGVAAIRQHQFGGAAADVQDQVGLIAEGHARQHAQVDQARLLRAAHQIHLQPQLLLDRLQEFAAVGGLPHGAGGGRHHIAGLHAVAGRQLTAMAQGGEGPFDRLGAEVARLRIPLPQAGGRLLREQHRKAAQGRVHLGDQQVNRVGADVDARHRAERAAGGLGQAPMAAEARPLSHRCRPHRQP